MHVKGYRAWEQCLQKVKSTLHRNTLDSESSYKQKVLTDQVSASLHSAGVPSMKVFPVATIPAPPIRMGVRKYKGHKTPKSYKFII